MKALVTIVIAGMLVGCSLSQAKDGRQLSDQEIELIADRLSDLNEQYVSMLESSRAKPELGKSAERIYQTVALIPAELPGIMMESGSAKGAFGLYVASDHPEIPVMDWNDTAKLERMLPDAAKAIAFAKQSGIRVKLQNVEYLKPALWRAETVPALTRPMRVSGGFRAIIRDQLLGLRSEFRRLGIDLREFTVEFGLTPKVSATFTFRQ